ncbi:MAG TPA: hypothetical protein VEI53_01010, partial [Ktedonobacteraceae bacterium]|nr:hypothetical protein [Ktedonobacteraceae bacterium]
MPHLDQFLESGSASVCRAAAKPDGVFPNRTDETHALAASGQHPARRFVLILYGRRVKIFRGNNALGPIIVMAATLPVMGRNYS